MSLLCCLDIVDGTNHKVRSETQYPNFPLLFVIINQKFE